MIGEYNLELICNKYGLSNDKIIGKNNNILTYGEYIDIDKTLNFLINQLHIASVNIEKCPSIMYRNIDQIEKNVIFLKSRRITFSNIETCLHVLSTDSKQLSDTYEYVEHNYGVNSINKNTSILSCSVDLIKTVEFLKLNIDKNGYLTIAVAIEFGGTKLEEIQKIIQSKEYQEHPEMFTSTTLAHAKLEEIKELLKMDIWKEQKYAKLLTSSVVAKSKMMITKLPILIELAEKYCLTDYINTSFLLFSPSQNYALIKYLEEINKPLIIEGKLNPIFGKQPGVLLKKYGIDLKIYMSKYPIDELKFGGKSI